MRTLIVLVIGLLLFSRVTAQKQLKDSFLLRNAYEVAMKLDAANKGAKGLGDSAKQLLLGSMLWYANLQEEEMADPLGTLDSILRKRHYALLDSIQGKLASDLITYSVLFDRDIRIDTTAFVAIGDPVVRKQIKDYYNGYKMLDLSFVKDSIELADTINSIIVYSKRKDSLNTIQQSDSIQIGSLQLKIDSLKKLPGDTSSLSTLRASIVADTIKNKKGIKALMDSLYSAKAKDSTLQKLVDSITITKKNLRESVSKYMSDHRSSLETFLLQVSRKFGTTPGFKPLIVEDAAQVFNVNNQLNYQTFVTTTEAASVSAFQLPSQSEMIDAIAIYLANRVKQEAVTWFFEQLTKNISTFDLLKTFFPCTTILLQSREVYEIPNMGAQWRYALSKDFVNMPRNVLSSPWLSKRWPQIDRYKDYLVGACDIAELLQKKYDYKDIIRALYLADSSTTIDTSIHFRDFVRLLYAVNTELFVPDSASKYRMLKYEDYRNMNKDQMLIMLSLIDLKYGGMFYKFFKIGKDSVFNFNSLEQVRKWLGQIEIAISQFEQMRGDFVQAKKSITNDGNKDFYSTDNVWNAVDELLHFFISTSPNSLFSPALTKCNTAFKYIDQVHEIYGQVSNKNFAGAVQSTLALIDTLFYSYADDSDINLRVGLQKLDSIYSPKNKPILLTSIQQSLNKIKNYALDTTLSKKSRDSLADISNRFMTGGSKKDSIDIAAAAMYRISSKISENDIKQILQLQSTYSFGFSIKDSTLIFTKHSAMAAIVFENDRHAIEIVRKLSGFLNDAALAKDDKQLSKVVESYALPTGSYKRKRCAWWSLDLNAFVGIYAGYERPTNLSQASMDMLKNKGRGFVYGLTAPIGISLSRTFGRKYDRGANKIDTSSLDYILNPDLIKLKRKYVYRRTSTTLTFSFSIVDLGAVVSYRFGNQDSSLPQLKWSQFISPALHIAYGIPGTPLVASAGVQYTPQLRSLKDNTSNQYNAYRVYAGVLFDLPLFNLWERKRISKVSK